MLHFVSEQLQVLAEIAEAVRVGQAVVINVVAEAVPVALTVVAVIVPAVQAEDNN